MNEDMNFSHISGEPKMCIRGGSDGAHSRQVDNVFMLNARSSTASSSKGRMKQVDREDKGDEHVEFDEDDFECALCEAGGTVEPKRHFGNPTGVESDEHNLIHCFYRRRCFVCTGAQGKEDLHHRSAEDGTLNDAPVTSMDYKELRWIKFVASHVVKAKGSIECARRLVEFLDSSGCNEIVFKSDNG